MMDIKRREGESLLDYKIRICSNKAILNLTWEQVKDILNKETGQNFTESAYRKWYQNFADGLEYASKKNAEVNDLLEELEQKKKEFEIAKIQFQDQRREYRKYLRHEARLDHLLKTAIDFMSEELATKKPLEWIKPVTLQGGGGALAFLLSDIHKGMITNNHWNTYNEEVFYERLNQALHEIIAYQKITQANELHIFDLGDSISGVIHRLTKITETEDAVKSTQKVAEALAEFTSVLASKFQEVHYYSVKGNHDRVSARKEEEVSTESFHKFIPWYMEARLAKHENVTFHYNDIDDEIIVAEILGNTYFGVHGHLDNVSKVIQDLTLMIKKVPTAIFMGHIHKNYENEIHSIDLIINGSFCGTDDYAKNKRLTSKAHQKLIWLDENGRRGTFYIRFN